MSNTPAASEVKAAAGGRLEFTCRRAGVSCSRLDEVTVMRHWFLRSAVIVAMVAVWRIAAANTITVNTTTAPWTAGDGRCGLLEAIYASQYRQARDACPAGNGADTIQLGAGTYPVPTALEVWSDNLTFRGPGMGSTVTVPPNPFGPSVPTGPQRAQ